jgi:hypothetical protein
MKQASIGFAQYVVTAKSQDGVVKKTRTKAASAVVLAKAWIAAGYSEVQIVDPLGKALHPDGYRRAVMSGVKLYR